MGTDNSGEADPTAPGEAGSPGRHGAGISGASSRSVIGIVLASSLFVAVMLGLMYLLGLHKELVVALEWVEQQGPWAAAIFVLLMALVVVFLIPGVLFTTGAGFVFGLLDGTLYVVAGTTLGAAAAFLIARYVFGDRARHYILSHNRLRIISDEFARHDFRVVLLTRLIPFFPGKLSNYVFGLTHFSFRNYVLASAIGFIPFSLHNVYLGSLAADLADLTTGGLNRSPAQWAVYGLGFVATVVAVAYFNRIAQQSLSRISDENELNTPGGDSL